MAQLKWTRSHESTCGRFNLAQGERSKTWRVTDRHQRDHRGNAVTVAACRTLAEAKRAAQAVADRDQPGKPLIDIR
jgi:hypothetical protein